MDCGVPPLRPPLARLYWRPKRRRVRPVLQWVGRSGGTTWAPCEASVGRIRTASPVARIGRASPSAHPVGRQPTVDPFQRAFARPSSLARPRPSAGRLPATAPARSLRRLGGAASPASHNGRRLRRHPPRPRRAGLAARRRPARITPQRGGGGGGRVASVVGPDAQPSRLDRYATDTLRVMRLLILGGT